MRKEDFSKRLRFLIDQLNVSCQDFAFHGGISNASLSGYLNSSRLPRVDTVYYWAKIYNINPQWLITGAGNVFLDEVPVTATIQSSPRDLSPTSASYDEFEEHSIELYSLSPQATAIYIPPKKVAVLAGSRIKKRSKSSISNTAQKMRDLLYRRGWLIDAEAYSGELVLKKNTPSMSPSAAAGFVKGCSVNGNKFWLLQNSSRLLSCLYDSPKSST